VAPAGGHSSPTWPSGAEEFDLAGQNPLIRLQAPVPGMATKELPATFSLLVAEPRAPVDNSRSVRLHDSASPAGPARCPAPPWRRRNLRRTDGEQKDDSLARHRGIRAPDQGS
jgi:hypothetical protein